MKMLLVWNQIMLFMSVYTSLCRAHNFITMHEFPNSLGSITTMNRNRIEGYRLNVQATLSKEVSNEDECFRLCLKNPTKCLTYNVVNEPASGTIMCELLDVDALVNKDSYVKDSNSTYFGLQTKCWDDPCKNNATCTPDYETSDYSCNCAKCNEGKNCEKWKKDNEDRKYSCADYCNPANGVYQIYVGEERNVYCEMGNERWTLIQRRMDGSVHFNRTWQDYKTGFGDPSGEYWLGNDAIHDLTKNTCKLKFTMEYQGQEYYAIYDSFSVGGESTSYTLSVSGYHGTAGDSFSAHSGQKFSTWDQDNDKHDTYNCAQKFKGGGWYRRCMTAHINGLWATSTSSSMHWKLVTTVYKSLNYLDIKVLC